MTTREHGQHHHERDSTICIIFDRGPMPWDGRLRAFRRVLLLTLCVPLTNCGEGPSAPAPSSPRLGSPDVRRLIDENGPDLESSPPWLDELSDGYTDNPDDVVAFGNAVVGYSDWNGIAAATAGGDDIPSCDIRRPGEEYEHCPPIIVDGGGGGCALCGGNWWPSPFPPPPLPPPGTGGPGGGGGGGTDQGGVPPGTQPPTPRVVVSGYTGVPNRYGYRAPKRVTIQSEIIVTLKAPNSNELVHFKIERSTWIRAERLRAHDVGTYGVGARYVLEQNSFVQTWSSWPGARLIFLNNVGMISKLRQASDGSWGGGFAQSSQPAGAMWLPW
jgi:hypothetical protein